MGILCDVCRRYLTSDKLGLHPKEQSDRNQSLLVGSQKCPLRPLIGAKFHDLPFLPEFKSVVYLLRIHETSGNVFFDTGLKGLGYLWLRIPYDSDNTKNHPLSTFTTRRTVESNARACSVLKIIKTWLNDCDQHHGCLGTQKGNLPSRVLDLGSSGGKDIRLIDSTNTLAEKYIALSHCWGKGRPLILTTENYASFLEGISVANLPATFRDSIDICRRLGVRYLWIDSLCIIQNDAGDWAREAQSMGSVYHNAYLTISAARSASDSEEFLQRREALGEVTTVDMIDRQGATVQIAVGGWNKVQNEYQNGRSFVAYNEPISKRAWTTQERYLSGRKLFFCRDQVFWECQVDLRSEDGFKLPNIDYSMASLCQQSKTFYKWYRVICDYTQCELTFESDIFPALSGLVQRFAEGRGISAQASYCAGLWTEDIARGLSWSLRPRHTDPFSQVGPGGRPYRSSDCTSHAIRTIQYQAPTFSWASWRGAVYYWHSFRSKTSDENPKGTVWIWNEPSDYTYVKYIDHRIIPKPGGDAVNGPFQEGWLQLCGLLWPVTTVAQNTCLDGVSDEPFVFICTRSEQSVMVRGSFDDDKRNASSSSTVLYVLPLHATETTSRLVLNFLVLERDERTVGERPTFSRVGFGSSMVEPDLFEREQQLERRWAADASPSWSFEMYFALLFAYKYGESSDNKRARKASCRAIVEAMVNEDQIDIVLV
ncbi:HET-domain-containing protein [Ophiobolus disseminans]|uniref:HET-domain-containing protein n=1 Tax=Ophiobolus disseminans TaxID=1469910 RepID=A0A6A6ZH96_9PLEO|nr:HET-domain-containing protein [Ophiobolus disseminans]